MFSRIAKLELVSTTKLTVGKGDRAETTIAGLRVSFTIKRTLGKNPNDGTISVYNLAAATRALLERRPLHVRLFAGYADTEAQLVFAGDVRFATHSLQNATWETKLELGEAERTLLHATLAKSYAAGVSKAVVLKDLCAALQVKQPRVPPALDAALVNGFTCYGRASDSLHRLLSPYRYTLTDGVMRLEQQQYELVAALSEQTGLRGTPEIEYDKKSGKPKVLRLQLALSPELQPGSRVSVKSDRYTGVARIESAEHSGDTHSGDWSTKLECKL